MPAPTCTAGPSRPSGIPHASVAEVQKNLPKTVAKEMRPPRAHSAAFVCGTPLPRASGKNRYRRYPMASEPTTGTRSLRQVEEPTGYKRAPDRSVIKMKATTIKPTNAPIKSVRTRKTCSSRWSRKALHCLPGAFHQGAWTGATGVTSVGFVIVTVAILEIYSFCAEELLGAPFSPAWSRRLVLFSQRCGAPQSWATLCHNDLVHFHNTL